MAIHSNDGCDCVNGSLSSNTDLAPNTWLESRRLLQICCKFDMSPQNRRTAEAVLTITLTQHCQSFNIQFLQSNTEFYRILLFHMHFHIHVVTNAQLWQHELKFLIVHSCHYGYESSAGSCPCRFIGTSCMCGMEGWSTFLKGCP